MHLIFLTFLYFFNNESEERIIEKVLKYSPPELKIIVNDNYDKFKKGLEDGRKIDLNFEELENNVKKLCQHFKEKKSVGDFTYELGKLSIQAVRNVYSLPVEEDKVFQHIKKDFPLYLEKKLGRFPVVFYGFSREIFKGDIKNYIERESRDKKEYTNLLKYGYLKGDILLNRFNFDDRSNAFGIGQILTNKSFSLIINIWYYIWIRNGGRWVPLKPHQINNKLWVLEYGY